MEFGVSNVGRVYGSIREGVKGAGFSVQSLGSRKQYAMTFRFSGFDWFALFGSSFRFQVSEEGGGSGTKGGVRSPGDPGPSASISPPYQTAPRTTYILIEWF